MSGDIREAKQKLPLPALLHRLGLGQHAKKSAHCPFHDDKHNSFSIWQRQDGSWRFKCHAGCGEGDEITFLEKHYGISNKEAIKRYLAMAGADRSTPNKPKIAHTGSHSQVDWRTCVDACKDADAFKLVLQRRYSRCLCSWLKQNGLIGMYNGCFAFPVHDRASNVVAIHYRLKDGSWRYNPQGVKVCPLVIGQLVAGDPVHVFESYWDAFAFMDTSGERSGIIITRGASNGAFVAGLIPDSSTAFVWTQNDAAGEKWERDVCGNTKAVVKRARIPTPHKDLNDWIRARATADDLLAAIMKADVIREAENRKSESAELPETTQALPFPLHCLPPACEAMGRAVCETVRVLESLPGCSALGLLSSAIGVGLQVRSGPNRVTRGNLYILGSAESGSGKSETFRHLAKPFLQFEAERLKAWKVETLPGLLAERDILEGEIDNLKKQAGKADDAVEPR